MSRLLKKRKPSNADTKPAISASTSGSSLTSETAERMALPEVLIPQGDFRGSMIMTSLSKRFSVLRTTPPDPFQLHSAAPSASSQPLPLSLADIRARLAHQRHLARTTPGLGQYVTEEEEDLVLEELRLTRLEEETRLRAGGRSAPPTATANGAGKAGYDFRKSPSEWSLEASNNPPSNTTSLLSPSPSSSSLQPHSPPKFTRPGGSGRSYGFSSSSNMREEEVMRRAGKTKKSGSERSLASLAEGSPVLEGMSPNPEENGFDDMRDLHSPTLGAWQPPISGITRTQSHRKSLLHSLSPESYKRVSMALIQIEEQLAKLHGPVEEEDEKEEVLEAQEQEVAWDGRGGSGGLVELETPPRKGKGHEGKKPSITRSPKFHESLALVAGEAEFSPSVESPGLAYLREPRSPERRTPTPTNGGVVPMAASKSESSLVRKSSRAGRSGSSRSGSISISQHSRHGSSSGATSPFHGIGQAGPPLIPPRSGSIGETTPSPPPSPFMDPPATPLEPVQEVPQPHSAPVGRWQHGRSASSQVSGSMPAQPHIRTRERSASTSNSAIPVNRESIVNGYVPGASRPFTPPRPSPQNSINEFQPTDKSQMPVQPGGPASQAVQSRNLRDRLGQGGSRLPPAIKPIAMERSASGGHQQTISPVVESFDESSNAGSPERKRTISNSNRPLLSAMAKMGHVRQYSAGSSPLAQHHSSPPEATDDEEAVGETSFDASGFYGSGNKEDERVASWGPAVERELSYGEGGLRAQVSTESLGSSYHENTPTSASFGMHAFAIKNDDDHDDDTLQPSRNGASPELAGEFEAEDLLMLQMKLVMAAKEVRLMMGGGDSESRRSSASQVFAPPLSHLRARPSIRARNTEPSTYGGIENDVQDFARALSPQLATSQFKSPDLGVPSLQRHPTNSSAASSTFAKTPSIAQDYAIQRFEDTNHGKEEDSGINFASTSNSPVIPISASHPALAHALFGPEGSSSMAPQSPHMSDKTVTYRLEDDPAVRREFEAKIAKATAELNNVSSTTTLSRKNTKTKAKVISSPQLVSTSSNLITTPITSPLRLDNSRGHSRSGSSALNRNPSTPKNGSAPHSRNASISNRAADVSGTANATPLPDAVLADPIVLEAPLQRKKSFGALLSKFKKNPEPAADAVPATPSRTAVSKANFLASPANLAVKSTAAPQDRLPRTAARPSNAVVRRTIIIPQDAPPASTTKRTSPLPSDSISRKPSTHRKPVQPLEDIASAKVPRPTSLSPDTAKFSVDSRNSRTTSQQSGNGSLLDMYMDDRSTHHEQPRASQAIEICEMSNGNLTWKVLQNVKKGSSGTDGGDDYDGYESIFEEPISHPEPIDEESGVQIAIKGAPAVRTAQPGAMRPETKVYHSSSTQVADLIDDLSRTLDHGSFNITPSTEPSTPMLGALHSPPVTTPPLRSAASPTSSLGSPPIPVEDRLRALLRKVESTTGR